MNMTGKWKIIFMEEIMKKALITLFVTFSLTFSWQQSQVSDIAGYKFYYGSVSGEYLTVIDVGNKTFVQIDNFKERQTVYSAVTAYDTSNNESNFSKEFKYTIPSININIGSNE